MSVHHEELNKNINKEQQKLQQPQTAANEQLTDLRTMAPVNKETDVQGQQQLNLPATRTLQISDKKKYQANAAMGRATSKAVLQLENGFLGDSTEMKNAKNSVDRLETLLEQPLKQENLLDSIKNIEFAYLEAISYCKHYCEKRNPSFETGMERKLAVQKALINLSREAQMLAEARKLVEENKLTQTVNSGQDLLTCGLESIIQKNKEKDGTASDDTAGIQSLSYEDFALMLGTHNRGQVEFNGRGLSIINNGKFSLSSGKASLQNRMVAQRFLATALTKLGDKATTAQMLRFRSRLGLDSDEENIKPITREAIHEIVSMVNSLSSTVERTLTDGGDPASLNFAQKVNDMFAVQTEDAYTEYTSEQQEKQLKTQINSILEGARKQGLKVPKLTKHQMDVLVKGNLAILKDQIFHSVSRTYACMTNISGGKAPDAEKTGGQHGCLKQARSPHDTETDLRDRKRAVRCRECPQ